MKPTMRIEVHYGDSYDEQGRYSGYWKGAHWVEIPEPYQAGESPNEHFARLHGVYDRLIQYGQQPREGA